METEEEESPYSEGKRFGDDEVTGWELDVDWERLKWEKKQEEKSSKDVMKNEEEVREGEEHEDDEPTPIAEWWSRAKGIDDWKTKMAEHFDGLDLKRYTMVSKGNLMQHQGAMTDLQIECYKLFDSMRMVSAALKTKGMCMENKYYGKYLMDCINSNWEGELEAFWEEWTLKDGMGRRLRYMAPKLPMTYAHVFGNRWTVMSGSELTAKQELTTQDVLDAQAKSCVR